MAPSLMAVFARRALNFVHAVLTSIGLLISGWQCSLECVDTVEAFALEAEDLQYVTSHFQHRLQSSKLRRTIRHYSPVSWLRLVQGLPAC
jgi:hypothetical protein